MTTTTASIRNPNFENMAPQDALDFALIIGKVLYCNHLSKAKTLEELDTLRAPWLALPVDWADSSFIYNILDNGGTIRKDTSLTDDFIINLIKGALVSFIEFMDMINARGTQ